MDAKLDALLKKSESSITPEAPEQPNIVPLLKDCLSRIDQVSSDSHISWGSNKAFGSSQVCLLTADQVFLCNSYLSASMLDPTTSKF